MLRILITGSRDWDDWKCILRVFEEFADYDDVVLVSGHHWEGADYLCEQFAKMMGWVVEEHPADWRRLGKRAGFVRNAEMVKLGADICLAFIKDGSKGATMTAALAEKAGIKTEIFRNDDRFRGVSLRPHQIEAVEKLSNGRILCGGVGVGKSITAAAYYWEKEAPRDVYVITTAKKRDSGDWESEFIRFGVGKSTSTAGILTVDSWNNVDKYRGVYGAFFIFDEQRLVGSGAWTKAFLKIAKKNHWILLSATPGDTWLDYIPVFVANGFYENRTQFKRDHVVYNTFTKFPKVDRYTGQGKLLRLRAQLLVHMPYLRHTTRHPRTIRVEYDKELFRRAVVDRWHVYENRPIREVSELFSVMRRVVNSDPSRLAAVRDLMEQHPRLIVFYNFNYELEMLRTLGQPTSTLPSMMNGSVGTTRLGVSECTKIESSTSRTKSGIHLTPPKVRMEIGSSTRTGPSTSTGMTSTGTSVAGGTGVLTASKLIDESLVPIAEWNGHKHEEIPKSDRWLYLVQYTAGAEGWNCVETNATCFYSPNYSYKVLEQARGRVDRLNTPFTDLFYYYLLSDSLIDKSIVKSVENKKTFNERKFIQALRVKTGLP